MSLCPKLSTYLYLGTYPTYLHIYLPLYLDRESRHAFATSAIATYLSSYSFIDDGTQSSESKIRSSLLLLGRINNKQRNEIIYIPRFPHRPALPKFFE